MLQRMKYVLLICSIYGCFFSGNTLALPSPFSLEKKINSIPINGASAYSSRTDLAFNSNDQGVIVWNDLGSPNRIFARRVKPDGTGIGSDIQVSVDSTLSQEEPAVGIDAQGNFVVAWQRRLANEIPYVVYRRYSANGVALGNETSVASNTTINRYQPDLAMHADGRFIITWSGNSDIYVRRFAANGAPLDTEIMINKAPNYEHENPKIVMNSAGVYAIAWESKGWGDGWDISFRTFDINGNALIAETQANNESTGGDQKEPAIALGAQGNLAVAWHCYFCDGATGWGVKAKRFNADGSGSGNEFIVNTYKPGNQMNPAIVLDQENNLFIAWSGENSIEKVTSIYGQFFFPDNTLNGSELRISNEVFNGSSIPPQVNPIAIINSKGVHRISWFGLRKTSIESAPFFSTAFSIDAGKNKRVNSNSYSVDLLGTSNLNLAVTSWAWQQIQGTPVVLTPNNTPNTSFLLPSVNETLEFKLTATFVDGSIARDYVSIEVTKDIPNVNAGADQEVTEGNQAILSGTAIATNGGTITQYHWVQVAGLPVQLTDPVSPTTDFIVPLVTEDTDLVFSLHVQDSDGNTGSDSVVIRAKNIIVPPQVDAGADFTVNENSQALLNGVASDTDGTIVSYRWKQIAGPTVNLLNANSAQASFTTPYVTSDTQYIFELLVTDNNGATAVDTVNVTVINNLSNVAPTVNAGIDMNVTVGSIVSLSGTAQDVDGNIAQIQWSQISGPSVTFSSPDALATGVTVPEVSTRTTLVLALTVTDNEGLSSTDTLLFVVSPRPPLNYCSSRGTNAAYEWIASVGVNGYTNISGKNNGYASFPAAANLYLQSGATNSINLTPGFSSGAYVEYWSVWVDLNRNGIFDTSERLYSGSGSLALTGNIVLPSPTITGTTQMRISMRWGGSPSPCETFSYGEVEDYQVTIR